jgi:hypothetical protein
MLLRTTGFALLVVCLLVGLSSSTAAEPPRTAASPVPVDIAARPIESFENGEASRRRFGVLEFRGGLELTSSNGDFGGLSGLRLSPDGERFVAITDRSRWLRGRIVYDAGRPIGIADAEMAPMLGADGRTLAARGWYDTEGLAEDGGTLYVSIERVHQILRFDYGRAGLLARGQPMALPAEVKGLRKNKGIEALAFIPKGRPLGGTLVGISEAGSGPDGNSLGLLVGGLTPGIFAVRRTDDFDITDIALGPNEDLLILERRLSILRGPAMRLRRLALKDLKPGAVLDGPVLMEADFGFQIDNMEALAVHRTAEDEIVVTMLSDDNFFPIQRSLLLQFTLIEP